MAYFAEIDKNNVVLRVVAVNNKDTSTTDGTEIESIGIAFCKSLLGSDTNWKQTSYNANIRKNYAGIGYTYDATRDAFIPPKPYASWLLNEDTCVWESPVPYPNDGNYYVWDEATTNWVENV